MPRDKILYIKDGCRSAENIHIVGGPKTTIYSTIRAYNEESGEEIFKPLHNRTVIAGGGLTLQKLFGLDKNCLDNTPTYDKVLGLDDAASDSAYPTITVTDNSGNVIGSLADETQRVIVGFCVGCGGAGTDATNVFHENYASWIAPDMLVPFRYPLENADVVDETIYKGRKTLSLSDNQTRCAYYFKEFSNTPALVQNYVSTVETFSSTISPDTVYESDSGADKAQSFVELHLKLSADDCKEFFITHSGLEQAKINQISLVTAWKKTVSRTKYNSAGNLATQDIDVFQQIRPFSLCNLHTESLYNKDKAISIIYTLYA